MNKKLQISLITSLAVGLVNFSPIILSENSYQIVSVAYAAVENVTASNTAIFDFGEDDEKIVETVKNVAKMRAIQSAKEKAGVYVKSFSKTVNGMLTDDDISAYTSNNIEILNVTYKKIPVQTHDVRGNDTGKIAFMYEATVTAKIDTSDLQNYVRRDEKEKITIVQQNEDSRKNVEKIASDFEDLRKTSENKTPEQIKSEVQKIDNEVLAQQKFDEGKKLYYRNDYEGAISKYNEAIKINPNFAWAYSNRGAVYQKFGNYNKAVSDYYKALELDPNDFVSYNNLGLININNKNYVQALSYLSRAIKINPNLAEIYVNRGFVYSKLKNYSQAMKDFSTAIQLEPDYVTAYFNLGIIHYNSKNYSQAIKNFSIAIELNPKFKKAYEYRGFCYKELGQNRKAEEDFVMSLAEYN